jgi:hypothetical protein
VLCTFGVLLARSRFSGTWTGGRREVLVSDQRKAEAWTCIEGTMLGNHTRRADKRLDLFRSEREGPGSYMVLWRQSGIHHDQTPGLRRQAILASISCSLRQTKPHLSFLSYHRTHLRTNARRPSRSRSNFAYISFADLSMSSTRSCSKDSLGQPSRPWNSGATTDAFHTARSPLTDTRMHKIRNAEACGSGPISLCFSLSS